MGQQRSVGIVSAAEHGGLRVKTRKRGDLRLDRTQPLPGRTQRRRKARHVERRGQAGRAPAQRRPEIGMRALHRHFARRHARKPPGPILRVGQIKLGFGDVFGESRPLPGDLFAEIESKGQPRRQRLRIRRAYGGIDRLDFVDAAKFIVHHRQRQTIGGDESARAGVGRRDDRIDGVVGIRLTQRRDQKRPDRLDVGVRIGRPRQHAVRGGALPEQGAIRRKKGELDVGLADIDDGDGPGHCPCLQAATQSPRRRGAKLSKEPPRRLCDGAARFYLRQKSKSLTLALVKMNGDPRRISLPLTTFNLPSLPASTDVAPGFSLPSATARKT